MFILKGSWLSHEPNVATYLGASPGDPGHVKEHEHNKCRTERGNILNLKSITSDMVGALPRRAFGRQVASGPSMHLRTNVGRLPPESRSLLGETRALPDRCAPREVINQTPPEQAITGGFILSSSIGLIVVKT